MTRLRVNADSLNVRSTPDSGTTTNILARLQRDQEVELLPAPTHPDWYFVRLMRDGATLEGWVARRLMAFVEPPKPARFRVNTDKVNVRATPDASTNANILIQLNRGDEVTALPDQPEPDWLAIALPINGKIVDAWVSRRLVISADVPVDLTWRMGINMREFVFYGTPAYPFTTETLQLIQINRLKQLGVKLVRIFTAHADFTAGQIIPLLNRALTRLHQNGMRAIVCLNDSLTGQRLYVRGNDVFHTEVHGHLHKRYWHNRDYLTHYIPFVQTLLNGVKHNPGLLMVELGNEYAIHPQPATDADASAFVAFCEHVGGLIKSIAPHVLISTGLVNSSHVAAAGKHELYALRLHQLGAIDAVSIHYYAHDGERERAPVDIGVARRLKKPWYVGEIGMERGTGDRASFYDLDIARWRREGAFTVMPWAFYTDQGDVGVCDIYGIGPLHGDFDALCAVISGHRA
ncbi:MAG: hypothetical protein NZM00_13890 [Anaerolinea sp.]|nr:hypothetical protein [Anaerolinea sp.]